MNFIQLFVDEIQSCNQSLIFEKHFGRLLGDLLWRVDLLIHLVEIFFCHKKSHFLIKNDVFLITFTNFFYFVDDVLKILFYTQTGETHQVSFSNLNDICVIFSTWTKNYIVTLGYDF